MICIQRTSTVLVLRKTARNSEQQPGLFPRLSHVASRDSYRHSKRRTIRCFAKRRNPADLNVSYKYSSQCDAWTSLASLRLMNHAIRAASCSRSRSRSRSSTWKKTTISSSHLVSTGVEHNFGVPLTIADVHLRNEQLPFAYFFPIPLCQDQLLASLSATLPQFAVLGGTISDGRCLSIQCKTTDSIPCAFSTSDQSKEYWLTQRNILRRQQSPELLPLFSPLSSYDEHLAKVKITALDDGSTVIGMTVSHMVADAASCFHFLNCWGNQMQRLSSKQHNGKVAIDSGANRQCNRRSLVTCSGMMTHETADVMGLIVQEPSWTDNVWSVITSGKDSTPSEQSQDTINTHEEVSDHDYIHLDFPKPVLVAMKAHGMSYCQNATRAPGETVDFVSINDMMTAFGWLMKRELSCQMESNVSMVVNLRGRCGIDPIHDNGLIGNGITHFTANMPGRVTNETDPDRQISIDCVSVAALEIRKSLLDELLDTPDRLSRSRLGMPPKKSGGSPSFSTTAWGSFPIWDIQFVKGVKLVGFHGQPAHPMPQGEMFASIIVPNGRSEDGFTYQLLAPKSGETEARAIHKRLCALFLAWHAGRGPSIS